MYTSLKHSPSSFRYILPIEPQEAKTEPKTENGKADTTVEESEKNSGPPRKKQKLTGKLRLDK